MGKSIWANWKRGKVVQRGMDARICVRKWKRKVSLDFELSLPKTATSRRQDLLFEGKEKIKIWVWEVASPQQVNIEAKRNKKYTKHRQLAFELRERIWVWDMYYTFAVGALVGGIKDVLPEVGRAFELQKL